MTGNLSKRQEQSLAADLGGHRVPASGAFWHRKGDVSTDDFLIEAKRTDKASITLRKAVWEKIRREALLVGKVPALMLRIQGRDLVVLDLEDFLALTSGESQSDMAAGAVPGL